MKWNLKPVSFVKGIAASLSAFTMCIAPVAKGAAAASNKQLINQFLKETSLSTKKMTVGQFWSSVRHVYPAKLQKQMDGWVARNKNQMMPAVEATSFKDKNGVEQVRLTLSRDGQSFNITFTGDEDFPVKVNGVSLSTKEMLNYNNFDQVAQKVVDQDPALKKIYGGSTGAKHMSFPKDVVMSIDKFKKLTPRQRAEYFIRLRLAMEAADKVLNSGSKQQSSNEQVNKYEFVLQSLFGDSAIAAKQGDPCIIAGYISELGADRSCGSELKGRALNKNLRDQMSKTGVSCGNSGVPCNPLVYGFNGSAAYCVPQSKVKFATRECNGMSKLRKDDPKLFAEDKKRIIESYLKNTGNKESVDLKINEDGEVSHEQLDQVMPFMKDLRLLIQNADQKCSTEPLNKIKSQRDDQLSACEELQKRLFSLNGFENRPVPLPPPVPVPQPDPYKTCEEKKPGSTSVQGADGKEDCVCAAPQVEEGGKCIAPPVVVPVVEAGDGGNLPGGTPEKPEKEKDDCRSKEGSSFWSCNSFWLLPLGLFGLGALAWWLIRDRNKTPPVVNVPPAPVPEPTPSGSPTPSPTVAPPPPAPTPPPVVVPPPVITGEGGTKPDSPGRAQGVR